MDLPPHPPVVAVVDDVSFHPAFAEGVERCGLEVVPVGGRVPADLPRPAVVVLDGDHEFAAGWGRVPLLHALPGLSVLLVFRDGIPGTLPRPLEGATDLVDRTAGAERTAAGLRSLADGALAASVAPDARRLAHDLNNAFSIVMSLTELLLASRSPDDPDRSDLEEILHACRRGVGTVRRLAPVTAGGSGDRGSAAAPDPAGSAVQGGRGTILLLEPDADARRRLRRALTDAGYAVVDTADDVEAGALLAGGLRPRAVVLGGSVPPAGRARIADRMSAGAAAVPMVQVAEAGGGAGVEGHHEASPEVAAVRAALAGHGDGPRYGTLA